MSSRQHRDAAEGVALDSDGRRVLLKWHKLRRAPHEPPFTIANLPAGLALGASMEIDIRLLADGHWVCLHDDALDEETDGSGPVANADRAAIGCLRIAGGDHAPPLLADMTAALTAVPDSGALLQLDLKEPAATLTEAGVAAFADTVRPVADRCLLSGADFDAVTRLADGIEGLRVGFDPCDMAETRTFATRKEMEAFVDEVFAVAPEADSFYLDHHFLDAALAFGVNPVAALKRNGATIDVWTLDPDKPDVRRHLIQAVAAGADQITTNDPGGLARLWYEG
ncbi:MAG: hypothetical protein KDJ86_10790 [Bauldia sp.]|uniref:glycerophosphodiester phosphodiesterase n=1 Tax=Bauldia sp. TaxID=2575872 RepID=UPI001DC7B68B|nr:glycerophosphodiester phosphodiesterase family protein [Bauldia sp.]MCB1496264.1 hypothetical protein [Bauldia sp.]